MTEPSLLADGKFRDPADCLRTLDGGACPRCHSAAALYHSYGLGSGYGIGSYSHCGECEIFLDFVPDAVEEEA